MNLNFNGKQITVIVGKEGGTFGPEDKFDESFKSLILGLSVLLKKESEKVAIDTKTGEINKEFEGKLQYLESIGRVLVAFEKFFVSPVEYQCMKNSEFTLQDASLIFAAINAYIENIYKPSVKLLKDIDPQGHKERNKELKEWSKLNNDWYMCAVGTLKEEK